MPASSAGRTKTRGTKLSGTSCRPTMTVISRPAVPFRWVFVLVSDPVAQGFADSLTKSGSNLTGFSRYEFSIGGKWLGLLKEISCGLARVAVLFNPETSPQSKFFVPAIESAASSLGVQALAVPARATGDIEPALESFARQPNGGLILHPSAGKAHRRFGASPSPADDQHG